MFALLRYYSLPGYLSNSGKWVLTLFGMSLSIALFVSVSLINESAIQSFSELSNAIRQKGNLIVRGNPSITDQSVAELRLRFNNIGIVPFSERTATLLCAGVSRTVTIVGTDFLQLPADVELPTKSKSGRNSLATALKTPYSVFSGSVIDCEEPRIKLNEKEIPLVLSLIPGKKTENITLYTDISWFQELFSETGSVNGIVIENGSNEGIRHYIETRLPEAILQTRLTMEGSAGKMTRAFRMNLIFLSCMGMLVAGFLLVTMNWYQLIVREPEFTILEELGIPRSQLFKLFLIEAGVIGVITGVSGYSSGYLLSWCLLAPVNQTLEILYHVIPIAGIVFSWSHFFAVMSGCVVLSVVGLLIPAWQHRRIGSLDRRFIHATGVFLTVLLVTGSRNYFLKEHFLAGFIAPTAAIALIIIYLPALLAFILKNCELAISRTRHIVPFLAMVHLRSARAAGYYAMTAISFAIGLSFALTVMVTGFRVSVDRWLYSLLAADIYLSAPKPSGSFKREIPEKLIKAIEADSSVAMFDTVRSRIEVAEGVPVTIHAVDIDVREKAKSIDWLTASGTTADCNGVSAYVSESFSRRFGTGPYWQAPSGTGFCIEGIFRDYESEFGSMLIDKKDASKAGLFSAVYSLSLFLNDKDDPEEYLKKLLSLPELAGLEVRTQRQLRNYILEVFDKTFAVPYLLQGITLSLSLLIVFVWVAIIAIQRRLELQSLRILGASISTLRKLAGYEALIIGAAGACGGILSGTILAAILVYVVNPHFFGWSISFVIPVNFLFITFGSALIGSWITGLIPACLLIREEFLAYEKND